MKAIYKILCAIILIIFWLLTLAPDVFASNINIQNPQVPEGTERGNEWLNSVKTWNDGTVTVGWVDGIRLFILKIAKDFKNLVFALSTMVLIVLVYRILFASNTEEEATKFRKWIIWVVLWIIVMQLSYTVVVVLFDKGVTDSLAISFLDWVILPLVWVLLFGASFAFLAMWIFAFYMIITANGDDEKAKKWRTTVIYAIVGFIVIRFAEMLVNAAYSATYATQAWASYEGFIGIVSTIINWLSPFTALVVVIMIIYAWAQLLFANGDEEKLKNVKKVLIYIFIGIFILLANYLIATFFLASDATWLTL